MSKNFGTIKNNRTGAEAEIIIDANELVTWGDAFKSVLPAGLGVSLGSRLAAKAIDSIPKKVEWQSMSTSKKIVSVLKVLTYAGLTLGTCAVSGLIVSREIHSLIYKGAQAYEDAEFEALDNCGLFKKEETTNEVSESGEVDQAQ